MITPQTAPPVPFDAPTAAQRESSPAATTYTDLKNRCQQHWLTRGPDLEGEAGYCLLDGRLYYWTWYYGEDSPQIQNHCSVAEFIAQADMADVVLAPIVEALQFPR